MNSINSSSVSSLFRSQLAIMSFKEHTIDVISSGGKAVVLHNVGLYPPHGDFKP
jgi:hypothetical protein